MCICVCAYAHLYMYSLHGLSAPTCYKSATAVVFRVVLIMKVLSVSGVAMLFVGVFLGAGLGKSLILMIPKSNPGVHSCPQVLHYMRRTLTQLEVILWFAGGDPQGLTILKWVRMVQVSEEVRPAPKHSGQRHDELSSGYNEPSSRRHAACSTS